MLNSIKPGELNKSFDYNNNNFGKYFYRDSLFYNL